MNIAIILSGGTGTRMQLSIPKQYVEVDDKPIIGYAIDTFQKTYIVDKIVIVCHNDWKQYIMNYLSLNSITKVCAIAESGATRQESILNGLLACEQFADKNDIVIIHDAARPLVTEDLIVKLTDFGPYDGVLPVIHVKDTLYYSDKGDSISQLLDRDKIYAGQAPESFIFGKYLKINKKATSEELKNTRGTSEIAFKNGLKIKLIDGDENNYKITTINDLEKFKNTIMEREK